MASSKNDIPDNDGHPAISVRLERLREQAKALNGGKTVSAFSPNCPPEVQEQFWKHVIAFENTPAVQPFELLRQSGLDLPPPEALDAAALTAKLWEVIRGLALLGVYLECTDHLG